MTAAHVNCTNHDAPLVWVLYYIRFRNFYQELFSNIPISEF